MRIDLDRPMSEILAERLAEADETGQVTTSYIWLGRLCVGRVAGPIGGALLQSYHWGPGARLLAVGDSDGKLDHCSTDSPFGAVPAMDGVPALARSGVGSVRDA